MTAAGGEECGDGWGDLTFFRPFAVTVIDLAVHLVAMLLVVGAVGLINRRALGPA